MISDLDSFWTPFLIIFLFWCRYQSIKGLPEVQQVHVQVGLYSFFHLLYGMFPCNFLSYLRVHYSENNCENHAVFIHTIKPMLNHVKMHPSLVTQTKDYEKNASRWKRMELHDIIVESSRYSLDNIIRLVYSIRSFKYFWQHI